MRHAIASIACVESTAEIEFGWDREFDETHPILSVMNCMQIPTQKSQTLAQVCQQGIVPVLIEFTGNS